MTELPELPPMPAEPSIAELFETDPLKLSTQDLDRIIGQLRKDRKDHLALANQPKPKPKGQVSSGPKQTEINLDELGL